MGELVSETSTVTIADGDGGQVYLTRSTGVKGRDRIRLSRHRDGSRDDPTFGPKAALELTRHLNDFIYQPPGPAAIPAESPAEGLSPDGR